MPQRTLKTQIDSPLTFNRTNSSTVPLQSPKTGQSNQFLQPPHVQEQTSRKALMLSPSYRVSPINSFSVSETSTPLNKPLQTKQRTDAVVPSPAALSFSTN